MPQALTIFSSTFWHKKAVHPDQAHLQLGQRHARARRERGGRARLPGLCVGDARAQPLRQPPLARAAPRRLAQQLAQRAQRGLP